MLTAIIGLVGLIVGVAITAALNFWSVRRSELERAVVAATLVGDELKALLDSDDLPTAAGSQVRSVADVWREHRQALVLYLEHDRFIELSQLVRRLEGWDHSDSASAPGRPELASDLAATHAWLEERTAELRAAHQAFILTPLIKYLRGKPWSSRAR